MPSTFMRRGEIVSGAGLALLGLYIARESLQWDVLSETGPGPGFFPLVYGILMVILSVALVVRAAGAGRAGGAGRARGAGQGANWPGVVAALTVWLAFVATIPLMSYFGFLVAVGLLMAFVTRFIYGRSIGYSVAAALITPALFYAIFALALQVRLPVGSMTGF
jgi:putative tricarboxylic transport membrane protein